MTAPEFDQKKAKLITLNGHENFYLFGGVFAREDNSIFCRWDELMTFLASAFPSNATIFDSQSVQMNHPREKMQSKGEQSHTLSYIRSISMPGNRHSTLQEALFVDILVLTDLLQPGLFAPNEENKAYDRLLMIQS